MVLRLLSSLRPQFVTFRIFHTFAGSEIWWSTWHGIGDMYQEKNSIACNKKSTSRKLCFPGHRDCGLRGSQSSVAKKTHAISSRAKFFAEQKVVVCARVDVSWCIVAINIFFGGRDVKAQAAELVLAGSEVKIRIRMRGNVNPLFDHTMPTALALQSEV